MAGAVLTDAWDLPSPHVLRFVVADTDIDAYRHVNNSVYMSWFDACAWDHSARLGLPIERCLELDRGMAVVRSVICYHRPALLGDAVEVATWLLPGSGKLRVRRRFQVRCDARAATLARAEVEYACIELSSGRPVRWPEPFKLGYVSRPEVLAALQTLDPV